MKPQYGLCLAISLAIVIKIQTVEFHSGQWIKMDTADNSKLYVFEMIILQEIQNCIESCKAKKQCKFINFDRRANLCYHIGSDSNMTFELEKKPGFSYGDKSEWNTAGYESCDDCSEYGVCKLNSGVKYSKCQNSGCKPPENKKNAVFHGNMFSVGNMIEYECMEGYKTNKTALLTSICLPNGTWSSVEFECLPGCKPPENRENAVVHGNMFSVGNMIEYECMEGYKTNKTALLTSLCLPNGTWSSVEFKCLPDDVHQVNDKFYKCIPQKQNWTTAKESCNNLTGQLVSNPSEEEYEIIVDIIKRTEDSLCYWIGGRRYEEVFMWLDGTHFADGYENWNQGEPNSAQGGEDCVGIVTGFDYKWNDALCSHQCYYICELFFV